MAKSSVCLSIRPSMTLRYRNYLGWKSSDIISPLVSLVYSLSANHNMTDLLHGDTEILFGIGVGHACDRKC